MNHTSPEKEVHNESAHTHTSPQNHAEIVDEPSYIDSVLEDFRSWFHLTRTDPKVVYFREKLETQSEWGKKCIDLAYESGRTQRTQEIAEMIKGMYIVQTDASNKDYKKGERIDCGFNAALDDLLSRIEDND